MTKERVRAELGWESFNACKFVGALAGDVMILNVNATLLAGVGWKQRIAGRLAVCFLDHRLREAVKQVRPDRSRQGICDLALGREPLIEDDVLRCNPGQVAAWKLGSQPGRGPCRLPRIRDVRSLGKRQPATEAPFVGVEMAAGAMASQLRQLPLMSMVPEASRVSGVSSGSRQAARRSEESRHVFQA